MTQESNSDRRRTGIAQLDAMSDAELAAWGREQREYQEELYRSLGLDPDWDVQAFDQTLGEMA